MKKILKTMMALFSCTAMTYAFANTSLCQKYYPHWNCNNPQQLKTLKAIDAFINKNADKGYIAAFDWDGTLYSETIPVQGRYLTGHTFSGQAVWLIWSAEHLKSHPNWFPLWRTQAGDNTINLINQDLYTEGKTNASLGDYSKFVQIAQYPAGMTPKALSQSVQDYLKAYPVKHYAFKPMLDVLQHMHDKGFKTWIITGSNPYFVANELIAIKKTIPYKPGKAYHFGVLPKNDNGTQTGHIAGNATQLTPKGMFSLVYNDKFVRQPHVPPIHLARYVVDQTGKALAIANYIQPIENAPVVFYAGNSGGDYQAALYVLHHRLYQPKNTKLLTYQPFTLAVKPPHEAIGTLSDVISAHPLNTEVLDLH